jgi:hypothetical protein
MKIARRRSQIRTSPRDDMQARYKAARDYGRL